MNASSIQDTLTQINNNTTVVNAEKAKDRTGKTDLDGDAFLQLLLTQMKYQDPLNPMSNEDFLAQQAQFTQISELQKLNQNILGSNQIMQASALIGKEVTLTNPENPEETITGTVTEAKMNANGASLVLDGGEDYPVDSVVSIKEAQTSQESQ